VRPLRLGLWLAVGGAAVSVATLGAGAASRPDAYLVRPLVSDGGVAAPVRDHGLVNSWGLAASPTGPWWTANEARNSSTLYSGTGSKQALTVRVAGGPTGLVYNGTPGFDVTGGGKSAPARFIYASEDGTIRGWSPTVPHGWSTVARVAVDLGAEAAVFRGLTLATHADGTPRLYATDFHNARVDVFDSHWRRIERRGAFVDPGIPEWYAPFGIQAIGPRIFVTYVWRAPVNGNDAPTGGYVDEFDLDGRLVARVGRMGPLNAPWGVALAPPGFGRHSGDLLVGNFGDGRVNVYREHARHAWQHVGPLRSPDRKPISINGLWGLAFGNGGHAGPKTTLFFASGPHEWQGATETNVHGLLGTITAAD
jgi:uncharacterized protein (TIGR03118 family)